MTIATEIEHFIVDQLLVGSRSQIGPDESLITSGVLDSLTWLQLATFVEQQYGITIGDDELVPENFESISAITALVERLRAAQ